MKNFYYMMGLLLLVLITTTNIHAQKQQVKAKVFKSTYFDKSVPLRDVSPMLPDMNHKQWKLKKEVPNQLERREYFNSKNAFPKGGDPIVQKSSAKHEKPETIVNISGIKSTDNVGTFTPPDTDGDVGPNYYFQMVNVMFEIFDKEGNSVYGPYDNKMLWEGFAGPWAGSNDGDPIVLYDENADRWIATQFALPNYPSGPFYELIAISETNDPLGSWYRYAFQFSAMPDYPKFGIWNDGYYMSLNSSGDDAVVFERDSMLIGSEDARMLTFKTPGMTGYGFKSALPACSQGNFPPAGTPNYFMYFNDDGWGTGDDKLMIWEFDVDWETPDNSTMTLSQNLPVEPFDSQFDASWNDISQKGTSQKLDAVPGAMMFSLNYRNFGTHQAIVANHTVDVDATNHAGVRWYELRNYNNGEGWQIYQQSTFAPDEHSRFMGSISMDGSGNIGLGYSVSSSSMYPSIRFTGRLASDPLNQMTFEETEIVAGEYSQTSGNRYGDYSMMSIDPTDDATFWYTNEYLEQGGKWATKIASFKLANPITSFISYNLENQIGSTEFDSDQNEIRLSIKYETSAENLIATFILPEGSVATVNNIEQISGETANDFSEPLVYKITHADTISEEWKVIVSEQIPENDILAYSVPNETRPSIIDKENHTVNFEMEYGTDLTELVADFKLSPGAIATVNGFLQVTNTTANDFSEPVIYEVKALNDSIQEWEVSASLTSGLCDAGASSCDEYISRVQIGTIDNASACEGYTDFSYLSTTIKKGTEYPLTITNGNLNYPADQCGVWIDWNNNRDFSEDELIQLDGTPGTGPYTASVIAPENAFEGEVFMRIRITYDETPKPCGIDSYGEVEDYKLFVVNGSNQANIKSFSFEAAKNNSLSEDVFGTIEDSRIVVDLPYGTDLSALISSFELSNGATAKVNDIIQESGITENNFSDTLIYTVTSEDETITKDWAIIVDNGTDIKGTTKNNINIYPNPANNTLHINGLDESTITIYNLLGETVKKSEFNFGDRTINISDLTNGSYILQITTHGESITTKINILH